MRIIAGRWRGRPILAPAGQATRPTSDRTREALFSMLTSRIGSFEGLRVADLFAGSGALGLEALSRGAAHCVFVETDRAAVEAIRRNLAALGASGEILTTPAEHARLPGPLDLAFLDPPYRSGLAATALVRLPLAAGAFVSVETARDEPITAEGFEEEAVKTFGKARITLLRRR
ncbi:MAG: rRNA (guanine966-N2)-methyltransferase [Sphingomonadales bacterium]|jgi:16S rRNA (guanine966-N2)-methyltransferase|nr:rRNA (guanine966-N2)-methyltransferase [Sphingomonadales bacterium]